MKAINLGSMNLDHVYAVEHFVTGGETISSLGVKDCLGGKGLNQSLAMARAGAEIAHAGLLGEGGEPLQACLADNGVDISLLEPCTQPQGHTVIQVNPQGQNCIIVCGGSNRCIDRDYIDRALASAEAGAWLLLQNEISQLDYAIRTGVEKGMKVVLNASPVDEGLLKADISGLEWLVVNEYECAVMAGVKDTWEGYACLKERYPQMGILLTLGTDGSISWKNGEEIRCGAFPVKAVDTTAAGDTYLGYFVASLSKGLSRKEAMETAAMAAAISVTREGAAPSIPMWDEVETALKREKDR